MRRPTNWSVDDAGLLALLEIDPRYVDVALARWEAFAAAGPAVGRSRRGVASGGSDG